MDVKIVLEPMEPNLTAMTGGGYGVVYADVYVDANLSKREQRDTVIHEVVEAFLNGCPHETIDQMTDAISDALDQLEDKWNQCICSEKTAPIISMKQSADAMNP